MAEAGGVPRGIPKRELWRRVPAHSPSGADVSLHNHASRDDAGREGALRRSQISLHDHSGALNG